MLLEILLSFCWSTRGLSNSLKSIVQNVSLFLCLFSVSLSSVSISSVFFFNYNPTHCFWILQMNLEYPWFVQCFRYNYISFVTLEFVLSLLVFSSFSTMGHPCFSVTEDMYYSGYYQTHVMMWNGARELIYNSPPPPPPL